MALQHTCLNDVSVRCLRNQPGRGPKRCPGCGGQPQVEEGFYGVFKFDPTGQRYGAADMVPGGRYQQKAAAERRAWSLTWFAQLSEPGHRGYVVRFVRTGPVAP